MFTEFIPYCIPVFKTGGDYLRLTRNGSFKLHCPASLKRQLDNCSSLLLVGDISLTKFVIVAFSDKPYYKVFGLFKCGKVDECIKQVMKIRMKRYLLFDYPLLSSNQERALNAFLDGSQISLFS